MGKYFKYAIGEILLVVIGILIALQINNWNEEKKIFKEEGKIINALNGEITNNIQSLDKTIKRNKELLDSSREFFKKYLTNSNALYSAQEVTDILGYATNKLDTSILNEILGTNSRALISDDETLIQLRKLKQAFNIAEKTEFYIDDLFNTQVIDFIRESGLGVYTNSIDIDENYPSVIKLDQEFFSLLGLFNGYQEGFLLSEQDLQKVLKETLAVLNKKIDND